MRHLSIPEQGRYLRLVPPALNWLRCLRRRSQRHRLTIDGGSQS
jgi:hypothetical protein